MRGHLSYFKQTQSLKNIYRRSLTWRLYLSTGVLVQVRLGRTSTSSEQSRDRLIHSSRHGHLTAPRIDLAMAFIYID